MSIQKKMELYVQLKNKITLAQKEIALMRKEEKQMQKEIQDYLNQQEETGIRVDEKTVITLLDSEKKISRNPSTYKEKVKEMLRSRGIEDEQFVDELLSAKTQHVIQQQRLKVNTTK